LYRSQALANPLLSKAYLAQVDNDGKTEETQSSSGADAACAFDEAGIDKVD
jgi:hypothetical protein